MHNLHRDAPAPDFCLVSVTGERVCLSDYRQRQPVVLLFPGDIESAPAHAWLDDYAAQYAALREWETEVLVVARAAPTRAPWPFPVLIDVEGRVRAQYMDEPDRAGVFVLDRYNAPYRWATAARVEELWPAAEALEWVRLAEFSCTMCDDASIEWELSLNLGGKASQ